MTTRTVDKRIIRVAHDKNNPYMMLDRSLPQNKELSYEAIGMLTYFLSKPDDWEIIIEDLQRDGCGRDKVYRILDELKTAGHLHHVKGGRVKGKFTKSYYVVTEQPHPEKPFTAKPDTVSPDTAKRTLHNRESTKQKKQPAPQPVPTTATVGKTRPKIFTFYEQTTGNTLTHYLGETILEACQKYGENVVQDAMAEAARNNARTWSYTEKILERWEREGRYPNTGKIVPIKKNAKPAENEEPDDWGAEHFVRGANDVA